MASTCEVREGAKGMTTTKERLKRVENEIQFRAWLSMERMIEGMSDEELEIVSATGRWPERSEPAPGSSRLDAMDRKCVRKLWQADQQEFATRSGNELEFFAIHGHWPERGCGEGCRSRG